MIKDNIPLSMAEASGYLEKDKETEANVKAFIKKFTKLSVKEAKELRKKLKGLDLMKMDEKQICKIIDVMPEKAEEVNKVFIDIGLDEDETKKILETIKEFK